MTAVLLNPETRWWCPNCDATEVTKEPPPPPGVTGTRFHICRGLSGLKAPMLVEGIKGKVEAKEREDYVGKDIVQTDGEGRVVMSIVTTRDEGQDVVVLAPAARGSFDEVRGTA